MVAIEKVQVIEQTVKASKMVKCVSTQCFHLFHLVTFVRFLFLAGLALLHCGNGLQGIQSHVPGEACCYLQPRLPRRAVRLLLGEMNSIFQILEEEISQSGAKRLTFTEPDCAFLASSSSSSSSLKYASTPLSLSSAFGFFFFFFFET